MENVHEIEEIIIELKDKKYSQIETVKYLIKNKSLKLKEADKLVLESEVWKKEKESTLQLRETFWDVLENYEYYEEIEKRIEFIEKYFELFKVKVEKVDEENSIISGVVFWENEEEKQEFSWEYAKVNIDFFNVKKIIQYLIDKNLVDIDKINLDKISLVNALKTKEWEVQKIEEGIKELCSIKVDMIDEGKKTDYFFIHF